MTDWGARHVEIAQLAMGMHRTGPVTIDGRGKLPHFPNGYNVPIDYEATLVYPDGTVMEIRDMGRAGIMFEGDQGRLFVNAARWPASLSSNSRATRCQKRITNCMLMTICGRERKASSEEFEWSVNYRPIANHVANFFDCIKTKNTPISDVVSQHRSVSTCHLVNISIRLGRKLTWDPEREFCVGDDEANRYLARRAAQGL